MMIEIIEKLEYYSKTIPGKVLEIEDTSVNHKPSPEKWSKKEILGHLVDSAINNLQRLIRVQYEPGVKIVYDQDQWVKIQNYQYMDIKSVVELWYLMNQQIIRIVKSFPTEKMNLKIDTGIDKIELHSAEFLIGDYLEHMEHHLKQIFGSLD